MKNKSNYFKDLIKNVFFIVTLLLSSLAMTFIVAIYDYALLSKILANNTVLILTIILACLIIIGVILYMCFNLKNAKITFADSLYLAPIIIGIGFSCFTAFALKTFTFNRVALIITFITIGLFFSIIRIHQYSINTNK